MIKKKFYLIAILFFMFSLIITQKSYAKYVLDGNLQMSVYIDKTPPVIDLTNNGTKETYNQTQTDLIKKSSDIVIDTSDNIKIAYNEFYYNPTANNFDGKTPTRFNNGRTFTEDGFYKIVAVDSSGNRTEIVFLIDKTPPDITYKFFKKGQNPTAKADSIQFAEVKENNTKKFLATGGSTMVYNESDLRWALSNGFSTIITTTSINCSSPLTITGNVRIEPTSDENAIRYSGYGSFITVNAGATLDLSSMVIDTQGAANHSINSINILNGGKVIFNQNSIVDGGNTNTGILVNSGGTLVFNSCHIANCTKGVVVKGNATVTFANLNNGRNSEFWNDYTAISFEDFTGTTNFNQSNIRIRNNTNGIVFASGTGNVNISNGLFYSNSGNGVVCTAGNTNISGGSYYSNGNGILQRNGTLNINGGTVYQNNYGINLESGWSGKMTITNINMYSNYQYSIIHNQNYDGNCTILGGTINGTIYLGKDDNYVNTNGSYPTLQIKPSKYFYQRKLVKTNSNEIASNEISKVTMTPNGEWYTKVKDEYIVIWKGYNVIIRNVDYYGNVLSTETITGNLGEDYSTQPSEIEGYDLISTPSNASGKFTENDIIVEYKYDIVNCVIVNYEDLLSGVVSAKYWYSTEENNFNGDGTDFNSGTVFEKYGYYKFVAINEVGLQREVTITLNKDSLTR